MMKLYKVIYLSMQKLIFLSLMKIGERKNHFTNMALLRMNISRKDEIRPAMEA
jgi:hypothetical protein